MTNPPDDDRSDLLGYESFLLTQLTDLDPHGPWKSHDLYQRRARAKYGGLSCGEFDRYLDQLEDAIDALPPSAYLNWLTTRHPPLETDASTQAPNLQDVDR